jgi:hypothetical protein
MLVLLLAVLLVPLAVAKLVLDYRSRQNRSSEELTLTVGELEQLVRRYVRDATRPLRQRIRELEEKIDEDHRTGGVTEDPFPLIDDPSLEDEDLRRDDDSPQTSSGNIA